MTSPLRGGLHLEYVDWLVVSTKELCEQRRVRATSAVGLSAVLNLGSLKEVKAQGQLGCLPSDTSVWSWQSNRRRGLDINAPQGKSLLETSFQIHLGQLGVSILGVPMANRNRSSAGWSSRDRQGLHKGDYFFTKIKLTKNCNTMMMKKWRSRLHVYLKDEWQKLRGWLRTLSVCSDPRQQN